MNQPAAARVSAFYGAIDAFQREHRIPGLQHAQIRGLLAEHLARAVPAEPATVPPTDRADLRDRIAEALSRAPSEELRADWTAPNGPLKITARIDDLADAVLAVLPEPADRAAILAEAADAVFALDYDVMVGEEGDENLGSMREAWDLGTIHAEKLLRRLAAEKEAAHLSADRAAYAQGIRDAIAELERDAFGAIPRLRRLAAEAQPTTRPEPCGRTEGVEAQQQPDTEPPETEAVSHATLVELVRDFLDPDPCSFDHHGYCQAHAAGFGGEPLSCPHGRARKALAVIDGAGVRQDGAQSP